MKTNFQAVPTPSLLLDVARAQNNICAMQEICDANHVELWPHIKTHKMVEIAKRQLAAGAAGLTCAKIGEAIALLPAFDERKSRGEKCAVFIAHSLVDEAKIPQLQHLAREMNEVIVACTSVAHAPALEKLLAKADLTLPVMLALDTGLGREGARGVDDAVALAQMISHQPHMELKGIYTHEGHLVSAPIGEAAAAIEGIRGQLLQARDAICAATGLAKSNLILWPGSSVSASRMAALPEISAVRPGAYVMGDLYLSDHVQVMKWEDMALTVLASVIDRPAPGLALIDAGSKVFSSDRTPENVFGRAFDGRDVRVVRVNEEHGYVEGNDVDELKVGEKLRFVPAHICPVVNLASGVLQVEGEDVVGRWEIEARGCVQ